MSLNDYDINRERRLVINLITNKEFCEEIIPILDLNLLESYELQQVAKKAVEHFQRYGSPIGRGIEDWWLEETQTGRFSKSEREFFAAMLQSLNDEYEAQKDAGNTTYEIEQTIQYLKKRHLTKHYAKVRELLDTEKVEEAEQLIANYTLPTFTLNNSEGGIGLGELLTTELPPIRWVVKGLLVEGATLLVGGPKSGKSVLALNIAIKMALGKRVLGHFSSRPYKTLYLTYEEPENLIQERVRRILGISKGAEVDEETIKALNRITVYGIRNPFPAGWEGITALDRYLEGNPQCKFVVIDILENFRPPEKVGRNMYRADYQDVSAINKLAEKHRAAILILHHDTKTKPSDWLAWASGSRGLTGAAASTLVLEWKDEETPLAVLRGAGRYFEGRWGIVLEGDRGRLTWTVREDLDPDEIKQTPERLQVLEVVEELSGEDGVSLNMVARKLDKSPQATKYLLDKLIREGLVMKIGRGKYKPI